ncbi:MAG: hypothetical protein HQ483_09005 [Rhodospirillales bacterium]|nr:hypothetical protein [Rhodospirillales bacterium]
MNNDIKARLSDLKAKVDAGELTRRNFLHAALQLGVSAAAAYAVLGDAVAGATAPGNADTASKTELLRRSLRDNPEGRIVSLDAQTEPAAASADDAADLKNRIARLRDHYQQTGPHPGPADRDNLQAWVAWDNDWEKWGNFENWGNWDNTWGNWGNWGNTQ